MPKKMSIILLFTLVIAVVALFAATEVMAAGKCSGKSQCPPSDCIGCPELPSSCEAGKALELMPQNVEGAFPLIINSIDANYSSRLCFCLANNTIPICINSHLDKCF